MAHWPKDQVQPELVEFTESTVPHNDDDYISNGCITDVDDQSYAYNSDYPNSDDNYE